LLHIIEENEIRPEGSQPPKKHRSFVLKKVLTREHWRWRFKLFGRISLEANISAYNLMNHPTFANPVSYLSSPLFGQSTAMANLMFGSGSPTTGLTPIFQEGGPRTVELGLKFTF
jgi:hypothetical protein